MLLYIDPGSGSIILQIVIAGVTGLIFVIVTLKNKIKAWLIKFFGLFRKSNNK